MEKETRVFQFKDLEVRQATEDEPPVIRGYAAVYDAETDLGEFREVVRPGAFAQAVERDDVRALFNHDANYVLGRNTAGTLHLTDDATGLGVVVVPPDTTWARDLITSMERGDVNQMSFAFSVNEQGWITRDDKPLRELKDVTLYDVSVVTYPAYPQTSAQARAEARDLMTVTDGDDGQAPIVESDKEQEAALTQARHAARVRRLELEKAKGA